MHADPQPNVTLVDVKEDAIVRFNENGIETENNSFDFDVIIFATGFDFMTGPLFGLGIQGVGGQTLQSAWNGGPRHYMGIGLHGFPNLFMVNGGAFCNVPKCVEFCVEWATECVEYLREKHIDTIEPTAEAVDAWMAHSYSFLETSIFSEVDSYFWGSNVPGKPRAWYSLYPGGAKVLKAKLRDVADDGYKGFALS